MFKKLYFAFGLSNTVITILSFNYGLRNKKRSLECVKYGIANTVITLLIITALFEIIAKPLSLLFSLSGGASAGLVDICAKAVRISAIGFVFMGFSIAVQGVFQVFGHAVRPLVISMLRLIIFVFSIAFLFAKSPDVLNVLWWTFPISEILTAVSAFIFLKQAVKQRTENLQI